MPLSIATLNGRPVMRPLSALFAALALTIVGVLIVIASPYAAHAAPAAYPTRPPKPAGNGWVWAMPVADLGTTALYPSGGGWVVGPSTIIGDPGHQLVIEGGSTAGAHKQHLMTMSEPYMSGTALTVGFTWQGVTDNRSSVADTPFNIGASASPSPWRSYLRCSTASGWVQASTLTTKNVTLSTSATAANSVGSYGFYASAAANCVNLAAVVLFTSTYQDNATTPTVNNWMWTADGAYAAPSYGSSGLLDLLCYTATGATSPDCIFFVPTTDGTNFDSVCASAPTITPTDWTSLGRWVGHYARCLFQPADGFDSDGQLSESISHWGVVGFISDDIPAMAQAASFDESCGALFDTGSGGALPNFSIDTCDWTDIGTTYKPVAVAFLWIFAAIFYVHRLIIILLSVWDARSVAAVKS